MKLLAHFLAGRVRVLAPAAEALALRCITHTVAVSKSGAGAEPGKSVLKRNWLSHQAGRLSLPDEEHRRRKRKPEDVRAKARLAVVALPWTLAFLKTGVGRLTRRISHS